jgi:hypothetical protein
VVEDSADADERLDREDLEALLSEFDTEMASGKHDKELLKEWGNDVEAKFLKARGIKPDYRKSCARAAAEMEVVMRGVPRDAAALALLTGQEWPAEAGDPPDNYPKPDDLGGAAELPEAPRGAGPPKRSG